MEKKNNSLIIIILFVIILGLGGFIVYDKVLKSDDIGVIDNSSHINNNSNSKLTNSFEAYKSNFIQKRKEMFDNTKNEYYEMNVHGEYANSSYSYKVSLDKVGRLTLSYNKPEELSKKFNDYEIASNVLLFLRSHIGNGGLSGLYFIKEDGSVSFASIEFSTGDKNFEIKIDNNIKELKNIVNLVEADHVAWSPKAADGSSIDTGGNTVLAIDINGNIYEV